MDIVKYPDPILRRGGKKVAAFGQELAATARQMLGAMYEMRGVGLAAPQVGLDLSLLVLNPEGEASKPEQEMVLVNPKITTRKAPEWGEEGCLSFPGIYAEVERHHEIKLTYQDLEGQEHTLLCDGFLARIIQHEIDHLQGVLFIDRLSAADRIRIKARLLDLERAFKGATV